MQSAAQIGNNSASYGQMITEDPAVIYRDDSALPALVLEIKGEIAAHEPDVSTKSGREAIASLAYSISRRKTPIIKAGAALTEDWRKKTGAVNSLKALVEKEFDALRDEARAELDAWEAKEKARAAQVDHAVGFLQAAGATHTGRSVAEIDDAIARVNALQISDDFGDSAQRVADEKASALAALTSARAAAVQAEEERAELARLRAEAEERAKAAREQEAARIAKEAEDARVAAAEKRAAAEAEARANAEYKAAVAAEARKAEEAQRALAAEQRRQQEASEAVQREADEAARRQADNDHRGVVMRAAKEALMEHAGISEAAAKKAVLAIVAGSIPSVTLTF